MGATLTSVFPLYKEHYFGNLPEIWFTAEKMTSPILAAMEAKSMDDGGGRGFTVPVVYQRSAAVSADFATAQTLARSTTTGNTFGSDRWIVSPVTTDAVAVFTRESILGAKGDSDKLLDVVEKSMQSSTMGIRHRMAHYVGGAGWGMVGTVLALDATTVTINAAYCNRLVEGDALVGAAAEGTGNLRSATSTIVTDIARDTGVLTVSVDPTGLSWVVGDIVFFHKGREAAASPTRLVITGLDGWFGTDTTLHNITRTGKSNLKAQQVDGASQDIGDTLVKALKALFRYGYAPDAPCYCDPDTFETLAQDRDASKLIDMTVGKFGVGFKGLSVSYGGYSVELLPDATMNLGTAYLGPFANKDYAPFFAHNGDLVNIDNEDGRDIRALDAATSYEARLYSRGNIVCPGPGAFARVTNLGT